jgi:hypothetical protein
MQIKGSNQRGFTLATDLPNKSFFAWLGLHELVKYVANDFVLVNAWPRKSVVLCVDRL